MKKIFERIPSVIVAVLAVGGVVLVLTAGLIGTSSSDALVGAESTKNVTLVQNGVVADLTFTPTVVGRSEIHAIFTPPVAHCSQLCRWSCESRYQQRVFLRFR